MENQGLRLGFLKTLFSFSFFRRTTTFFEDIFLLTILLNMFLHDIDESISNIQASSQPT